MSKAILRVTGIQTLSDLQGVGKHHIDRISETNKDIDRERSSENITLVNCIGNYNEMFNYVVRDLRKQHEEQMKKTRASRQTSFREKVNNGKADVACEFMMSASPEYFEGKSREEIQQWAETSLDFVTEKIGIDKKNVLHAVIHMDEKTPHLHVVTVPLIEKYDGRKKDNVLAISRKYFIKTREDMAQVQTNYVDFMNGQGFNLERGMEKSGAKHLDVARYKIKVTEEQLIEVESELEKATAAKRNLEKEKALLEKKIIELDQRNAEQQKKALQLAEVFDQRLTLTDDLNAIESRIEPVKRFLGGKDKEEEVKLPKKDFKRLIQLAERGVGAEVHIQAKRNEMEQIIAGHHEKLGETVDSYNTLARKYNSLLETHRSLSSSHELLKEKQNTVLKENKGLKHENKARTQFIMAVGVEEQFQEWNEKFQKKIRQQEKNRSWGMER